MPWHGSIGGPWIDQRRPIPLKRGVHTVIAQVNLLYKCVHMCSPVIYTRLLGGPMRTLCPMHFATRPDPANNIFVSDMQRHIAQCQMMTATVTSQSSDSESLCASLHHKLTINTREKKRKEKKRREKKRREKKRKEKKRKEKKRKERKEKKRKDYTFWRLFNEKPGNIPGCPKINTQPVHNLNDFAVSHHTGQWVQTLLIVRWLCYTTLQHGR